MQFDEFVRQLDGAVGAKATAAGDRAVWTDASRTATVTAVAPRNVSVALEDGGREVPPTTWYPVDAALVPVVSKRIAEFFGKR